jgi:hypothetical protein
MAQAGEVVDGPRPIVEHHASATVRAQDAPAERQSARP